MQIIKTEDGYRFYVLEDGRVVDSLDADFVDMEYPSLDDLSCEVDWNYLQINLNDLDSIWGDVLEYFALEGPCETVATLAQHIAESAPIESGVDCMPIAQKYSDFARDFWAQKIAEEMAFLMPPNQSKHFDKTQRAALFRDACDACFCPVFYNSESARCVETVKTAWKVYNAKTV